MAIEIFNAFVAPGTDPYDLYATDTQSRGTIPFTVTWPTEPQNPTTLISVTNDTQLQSAALTPNATITVAAGTYGALNISRNDQVWVLDNNATLSGLSGSSFGRVSITGGNVTNIAADVTFQSFSDLLIENVNMNVFTVNFGFGTNNFQRAAFIHNTLYAQSTGFFTPGAVANDVGVWSDDLIVAANYISGGMQVGNSGNEAALRIQSVRNVILVDNRNRCGIDGQGIKHTYRSHYGNQNYWMRRNMSEYGDGVYWQPRANTGTVIPNNYMGAHWIYDHVFYVPSNNPAVDPSSLRATVSPTNWPQACSFAGNVTYDYRETVGVDNTTSSRWRWAPQTGDVVGSNQRLPYQSPPALAAWLAADGAPPGADH